MARPKRKKTMIDPGKNHAEDHFTKIVQELEALDTFRSTFLKSIRNDLAAGLSPMQIIEKNKDLVKLRTLTTALSAADDGKALAAAKDLLDRIEGKAKESKEIIHRLDKLSDQEFDAILKSEFDELGNDEVTEH